jgi:hypothetical protein
MYKPINEQTGMIFIDNSSHARFVMMYDGCFETHGRASGLEAPLDFVDVDMNKTSICAIELFREDALLVVQALKGSLGLDDVA